MKKFVSVLLVMVMAFSALPTMAAENLAEDVLLKVKAKIDVPEEMTEFNYSENKYDDIIRFDFSWYTEDYDKELYVSSDSQGRIVSYSYYEQMDYSADKTLIDYTLPDAEALADAFVKKAYPEYFENETDTLVLNKDYTTSSYSGRYKSFSLRYERFHNGEMMESNAVTVRVRATKDKIYVQSASASLDNNPAFTQKNAINLSENDYTLRFPIKLYYATDYSGEEAEVTLFYSIEKGYVSRIDGVVLEQKRFDRYAEYGMTFDAMEESATGSDGAGKNTVMLTPEEILILEEMASLVPVSEIEEKLRGIEILHITEDMTITESSMYKYDDSYTVRFTLSNNSQNTFVTYEGETGEVISINTYTSDEIDRYVNDDKSEEKDIDYKANEENVNEFALVMAGDKLSETNGHFTYSGHDLTYNAERVVNGVPFPENRIRVVYDAQKEYVTNYSIYWDKDVSKFPHPEDVISTEKASEIIFGISPVYSTLVNTEKGYIPSVSIRESVTINALTGEEPYKYDMEKSAYTDIENHWAEEYINVLWEHDIYLSGDKFNPDEAITQADMIRLFSACREAGIIPVGWTKEYIVEYAFDYGYVETEDPDKLMTRREAFKAMANVLGYGDIAEFDIYKSSYIDMDPNGSAEILKAMGILIGSTARPDEYLTNAEAAVMVYRYLSK